MTTTEIQIRETAATGMVLTRREVQALEFTDSQRQLIRDAYAKGATDEEFAVLMEIAKARALNPLLRQVFFVARWDSKLNRETWATQVAIDGLRAIAERTGLYAGQDEPEFFENPDGTISHCKVRVYRKDWTRPAVGIAYFAEYVQTVRDKASGKMLPAKFWKQMPHVMIAKCAESLAIRKAFPEDTAGLYTPEEMGQADNDAPVRGRRGQLGGAVEARQLSDGDPRNTPEPDDAAEAAPIPALDGVADLAGVARWYAELALGADDSARAGEASGIAADHLGGMGYLLTAVEHMRALSGQLSGVLRHVHDVLAAEGSPDGVARAYGSLRRLVDDCDDADLRGDCKRTAARYFGQRSVPALTGKAAEKALAAALAPKPPPPTGTDDPAASPLGDAVAAANAQRAPVEASAAPTMRLELDVAETEARLLRADAIGDAAWVQRLADYGAVFAMAGAYHKRREAFRTAGVAETRRAQTLAAIEAREQRGPEAARQALDGYATRRVMPKGVGEVIRLPQRTTAKRTGTDD